MEKVMLLWLRYTSFTNAAADMEEKKKNGFTREQHAFFADHMLDLRGEVWDALDSFRSQKAS